IVLPSKVISDQYRDVKIVTKNDVIVGAIQSEDAEKVVIRPSPLTPQTVMLKKKDIVRRGFSGISAMPTGLSNWLSEDEVLEVVALGDDHIFVPITNLDRGENVGGVGEFVDFLFSFIGDDHLLATIGEDASSTLLVKDTGIFIGSRRGIAHHVGLVSHDDVI